MLAHSVKRNATLFQLGDLVVQLLDLVYHRLDLIFVQLVRHKQALNVGVPEDEVEFGLQVSPQVLLFGLQVAHLVPVAVVLSVF